MDRRQFVSLSLITGGGLILGVSGTSWATDRSRAIQPPTQFASLFRSRIVVPFCPGMQASGLVGFRCAIKDAVRMARFYKAWYQDLVFFADGELMDHVTRIELKSMNVRIAESQVVQMNEWHEGIQMATASGNYELEILYWDYEEGVSSNAVFA